MPSFYRFLPYGDAWGRTGEKGSGFRGQKRILRAGVKERGRSKWVAGKTPEYRESAGGPAGAGGHPLGGGAAPGRQPGSVAADFGDR